jgi:serine/threonine-protein kinase HipA
MVTSCFVNIWNTRIGAIAWNPETGLGSFEFSPGFLDNRLNVAPIKMSLGDAKSRIFSFPELRSSSTFKGLPGLLADVLPDKYGNALINAWLARQGRPADRLNPIEILLYKFQFRWILP